MIGLITFAHVHIFFLFIIGTADLQPEGPFNIRIDLLLTLLTLLAFCFPSSAWLLKLLAPFRSLSVDNNGALVDHSIESLDWQLCQKSKAHTMVNIHIESEKNAQI